MSLPSTMITYRVDGRQFTYRTVGVVEHGGRILLHRTVDDPYWALPGGRVELLESAAGALVRELAEELEVTAQIDRLRWIIENFFTHGGYAHHELGLYFAVSLPANAEIGMVEGPFASPEPGNTMIYQWFALDALPALPLVPRCLPQLLATPQQGIMHLSWTDPESELDARGS